MTSCTHFDVVCINPYELIRKYRCRTCGEIMKCSCEEDFGRRFLPHQLLEGTELETKKDVQVTLGFQKSICNACRDLHEDAHPLAEIYGRSSKIHRYYWREIFFETTRRFGDWSDSQGYEYLLAQSKFPDKYNEIEKKVIEEFKILHKKSPKYYYSDEPQSEVLEKYKVKVINLHAVYSKHSERKAGIVDCEGRILSVEDFTAEYYKNKGYQVLYSESTPFHVLFGIYMWLLVQDPRDPECRMICFGDRKAFEEKQKGQMIWTPLPSDFGATGYTQRRISAIKEHFDTFPEEKDGYLWLFDYWLEYSEGLRQYLWAHRIADIEKARMIVSILPVNILNKILQYLIEDYWGRYLGWPDLIVYNHSEYIFVEVKSSKDKLREDQKNWIRGNSEILHLPFELIKIHRQSS